MATLNLRRFSKPEMLRKIDRSHLITFFEPYTEYLSGRGIELPSAAAENGLDYTVMSNVLLNPNTSTPPEMSEALYYINEMSTPEGFDLIQEAIADTEIDVSIPENAAYGDLALQVWVQGRNITNAFMPSSSFSARTHSNISNAPGKPSRLLKNRAKKPLPPSKRIWMNGLPRSAGAGLQRYSFM